jgi:hypothetical protein
MRAFSPKLRFIGPPKKTAYLKAGRGILDWLKWHGRGFKPGLMQSYGLIMGHTRTIMMLAVKADPPDEKLFVSRFGFRLKRVCKFDRSVSNELMEHLNTQKVNHAVFIRFTKTEKLRYFPLP